MSKGESSCSESDDDIDSDYQSELASIIIDDQNVNTMALEEEHQDHGTSSDMKLVDAPPISKDSFSPSLQSQNHSKAEDQLWKVVCTSQVIKKLRHKKTPLYFRKAICRAINDLASGRHWVPVKTNNTEHQLFQRKIFQNRVMILWEKAVQFSPILTKPVPGNDNVVYFADAIRVWDIVIHERSCRNRITAIEKAWNREKEARLVGEKLKLCNQSGDQSPNQNRIFKCVLSDSETFDFQVLPPTDLDPNQYKPATLYTIPHNIEYLVSTEQTFELPITLWPEEHKIINNIMDPADQDSTHVVVLGRSGTGKTTCCLYRMVQEFLCHHETYSENPADFHPLRQLFVTKNIHLCEKFETQFKKLIASHSFDMHMDLIIQSQDKSDTDYLQHMFCPLFLTWDDFLQKMYHSLCGIKVVDDDSCSIRSESQVCSSFTGNKITADFFIKHMWKTVKEKQSTMLDPELVWMEIKSFIKGYAPSGELSLEQYIDLSPKIAPNYTDSESRQNVFKAYQRYKRLCETMNKFEKQLVYDESDLVLHLYHELLNLKHNESSAEWLFDSLYVDEVQDFTQCEVLLLMQSCKAATSRFFLTGDTAQTVMRDVSFRFKDMKTSFFKEIMGKVPLIRELTINYRSHSGILNLAQSVLKILEKHYPYSVDRVPSDNGMFPGPAPKFIKPCDPNILKLLIAANVRDPDSENCTLGCHQAIIVRTESCKEELPFDKKITLMFTIYEAKGLEYDDVLLYNFFSGCPKVR